MYVERISEQHLAYCQLWFIGAILISFGGQNDLTTLHETACNIRWGPQQCICCCWCAVLNSSPSWCTFVVTLPLCCTLFIMWPLCLSVDRSLERLADLHLPSRPPNYGICIAPDIMLYLQREAHAQCGHYLQSETGNQSFSFSGVSTQTAAADWVYQLQLCIL